MGLKLMNKEINRIIFLLPKTEDDILDDDMALAEGFTNLSEFRNLSELKKSIDIFLKKFLFSEETYLSELQGRGYTKDKRIRDITKDLVKIYLIRSNNQAE